MRRAEKRHVKELVDLLGQAHREIRKAMEKKQEKTAMDLLEQCQAVAIEMGNMIEACEGEGFITVRFLEDYCEALYQIYEKVRMRKDSETRKEYKVLQKYFIQIENSVRNDIPVRHEAVFLPYKAAMWDSLESVWRAADEDSSCDAYVIPIPYYDRNPDGSLGEMHYEGDLYPDYVPVTGYTEYDFAEHRPDMIFIHNPYDECNYVTSVHPFFYSKNLKQFTDQLIYIPYFILGETAPDNREAVEGIKHFCVTPGVINADKVIVQSEAMRQIYVDVMTEAAGADSRSYWEDKILGLGSPKTDKAVGTRREDVEIPEEWKSIIVKPDGSWKKIIFYNTSISALLQHGERMLEKIRDVLEFFKENQEEAALLWRPHPLMKATIESMRPQLWEEYQKIVDRYREEGWGIYDDTADMDRAIAMSDAYYGDGSSIVHLYQETGKPVMIQSTAVLEETEKEDS